MHELFQKVCSFYLFIYETLILNARQSMVEDFDPVGARTEALADWELDVKGASTMDYEKFHDCIFQLIDTWSEGIGES